ncbi:MAG: hypothetical protein RRC34_08630 [Lentisphaeria bacterium]|nr:hypothetical protein [Lentisphaeria bacterium]
MKPIQMIPSMIKGLSWICGIPPLFAREPGSDKRLFTGGVLKKRDAGLCSFLIEQ